ncbi:MAG TPA: hypothetical protein PLF13_08960 [candidate division Zixibacteria bacterium]|nr:hypothetical protein [candidate division Zixibacteria bacterium]
MKRNKALWSGAAFIVVISAAVVMIGVACSERDVYNVMDDDEILRYLRQVPMAKELFTTEGVFSDEPYYKDSDPGAEYRILVDSVNRYVTQYITPDSVEKDHGSPFGLADDNEVRIYDDFYVRIQRVLGVDTTYEYQTRYLIRWGYFLRIVSTDVYAGWVLHAVNLSQTRGGSQASGMDIYLQPEGAAKIDADGFQYEYFQYLKYVYSRKVDPETGSLYLDVDTVAGKTLMPYMLLSDIPEVKKGSRLVLTALNVPYSISDGSVRLRVTYMSDSGWTTSTADRIEEDEYLDTLWLCDTTSLNFNMLWFYESRYPDRYGGFWGTAIRVKD